MHTSFQIVCDKKPGVLLRTIAELKNQRLKVVKQSTTESSIYELVIEGKAEDFESALRSTQEIDGIIDVMVLDEDSNRFTLTEVAKDPIAEPEDLSISYKLAQAFPVIENILVHHSRWIGQGHKLSIFEDLGWQVAALRGSKLARIETNVYIEFLEDWLLPELENIADVELVTTGVALRRVRFNGELPDITLAEKTRRFDSSKCHFMLGYVQGLMAQSYYFTDMIVSLRLDCLANYQSCVFEIVEPDSL